MFNVFLLLHLQNNEFELKLLKTALVDVSGL